MFSFKPLDLDRLGKWLSLLRDLCAILFVPLSCLYAAVLVYILWQGGWDRPTETLRINYLGIALILLLALVGFGMFWLQRQKAPDISITAPGGFRAQITDDHAEVKPEEDHA